MFLKSVQLLLTTSGVTIKGLAYGDTANELYDRWWKNGDTETIMTLSDWKLCYVPSKFSVLNFKYISKRKFVSIIRKTHPLVIISSDLQSFLLFTRDWRV